jgi:hypothetical protein
LQQRSQISIQISPDNLSSAAYQPSATFNNLSAPYQLPLAACRRNYFPAKITLHKTNPRTQQVKIGLCKVNDGIFLADLDSIGL